MIAGKMKAKIELLEPKRATDRMGAEQVSYEPTRTVHAERVAMSGKRSEKWANTSRTMACSLI